MNLELKHKIPPIIQSEASECALACIAMIAGYWGYETSLPEMRKKFDCSIAGVTLRSVLDICDSLNLETRAIKLPLEHLGAIEAPSILHWNLAHFVVLEKVVGSSYFIHDPSSGRLVLTKQQVSECFTGVAVEVRPAKSFRMKIGTQRLTLLNIVQPVEGLKSGFLQLVLLALIIQTLILVSPYLLQIAVDDVIRDGNIQLLSSIVFSLIFVSTLQLAVEISRSKLSLKLGGHVSTSVAMMIFNHMIRLPISYFERRYSGDILAKFEALEPIRQLLTEGIIKFSIDIFVTVSALKIMLVYNLNLAFISLLFWSAFVILRLVIGKYETNASRLSFDEAAKTTTIFLETIRSMATLKVSNSEGGRARYWDNQNRRSIEAENRYRFIGTLSGTAETF